jgi:hypothetical protein
MGLLDTGQYNRPGQPQRYGLLDPNVMSLIQSGGPRIAPAPVAPQRPRVSGWRVFDRVLGGQTVTEGLDAERERLQAEAMRPQMEARRAQLRQAAEAMGPAAMLAFDLNPEKFGENLASQYSPQVIGAGGVQSLIGTGQRVSAPRDVEFGDSLVRLDPMSPQPQTLMTRGPTIQEGIDQTSAVQKAADDAERRRLDALRLELDRDKYGSDEEYRAALLSLDRDRFFAAQNAPRPGDNEDRAAIEGFKASNERFRRQLTAIGGDPQTGTPPAFDLSPANAIRYKAALATGVGMTPEAAAYGDYVSEIRAAVSDALRLNVGPQTDQDAIREAQALLSNIDNRDYVLRRLPTVMANNDRLRAGRERLLAQRRPNGGAAPASAAPASAAPAASGPPRVTTQAQYNALPRGAAYLDPNGVSRIKQ